jgi:NDP-sugar pyrophosphorylase family protein
MAHMAARVEDLAVAILAGGKGTRVRSILGDTPKCLAPVAGRPFIEHQFDLLRSNGLRRVVLCLAHGSDRVKAHVSAGAGFGLEVAFSEDGQVPLGTGGALRNALELLTDPFFLLYGDSFLQIGFKSVGEFFLARRLTALMTVLANEDRWDKSNVWYEDGRVVRYSKRERDPRMRHIDYGLSVLSHEAFDASPPNGTFDLALLFERLALSGRLGGYEVTERFFEIGSPEGYKELDGLLERRNRGGSE